MQLYKMLVGGKSCHNNTNPMKWSLPKGKRPGRWHKVDGPVVPCSNGLHLVDYDHIGRWFAGANCQIFEVETKGGLIQHDAGTPDEKWVASQVRLLRQIPAPEYWTGAATFIDSIKTTPFFKPAAPPKPEWKFFETRAAARVAARVSSQNTVRDTAGAAARAAAGDAAGAATRAAAGDAAWAAARAAAGDVAGAAAWIAVREATGDAVRDVAQDAVRVAAWDAAWDAIWDAPTPATVSDVAGDAAWDAVVDADLMARVLICDGLSLDEKHIAHAKARWEVWQMGYGLLCDIDGVLYVYEKP